MTLQNNDEYVDKKSIVMNTLYLNRVQRQKETKEGYLNYKEIRQSYAGNVSLRLYVCKL